MNQLTNVKKIENKYLYTTEYLENNIDKNIQELARREINMKSLTNTYIIEISNFIKDNFRKQLLFYSFNHPTKYLLCYITREVLKILNISGDFNINHDPFVSPKSPIYNTVFNNLVLEFNPCNYYFTNNNHGMTIDEFIIFYYKGYKHVDQSILMKALN